MNEKRGKILVLIKILSCVAKGMIGNIGKDISPTTPSLIWGNWDGVNKILPEICRAGGKDWRIDQLSKNGSPNYQPPISPALWGKNSLYSLKNSFEFLYLLVKNNFGEQAQIR